jgi:hypothetical protein
MRQRDRSSEVLTLPPGVGGYVGQMAAYGSSPNFSCHSARVRSLVGQHLPGRGACVDGLWPGWARLGPHSDLLHGAGSSDPSDAPETSVRLVRGRRSAKNTGSPSSSLPSWCSSPWSCRRASVAGRTSSWCPLCGGERQRPHRRDVGPHYLLFGVVEIVVAALIVLIAWKWPHDS